MDLIKITADNIEEEHICCAIANNKDCQVAAKKSWLKERLPEGLVFLKGNVRGKCFIEYIPAEYAWAPVEADGYMYIDCFWVAGQLKGQGYSNKLLEECIRDSREKGKKGLCMLSSSGRKKKPFAIEPDYLKYKGFEIADEAEDDFALWYLPFEKTDLKPYFKPQAKHPHVEEKGFVLYYTHQCPFTVKYVPLLEEAAREKKVPFKSIFVDSLEKAKNVPAPTANYALFQDGKFVTNEILSAKKFIGML